MGAIVGGEGLRALGLRRIRAVPSVTGARWGMRRRAKLPPSSVDAVERGEALAAVFSPRRSEPSRAAHPLPSCPASRRRGKGTRETSTVEASTGSPSPPPRLRPGTTGVDGLRASSRSPGRTESADRRSTSTASMTGDGRKNRRRFAAVRGRSRHAKRSFGRRPSPQKDAAPRRAPQVFVTRGFAHESSGEIRRCRSPCRSGRRRCHRRSGR
jgi:hypothetical protein